jgi:hypothetical protein
MPENVIIVYVPVINHWLVIHVFVGESIMWRDWGNDFSLV